MTEQGNSIQNPSVEEIQQQIQAWLLEEGWRIRSESVPEAEWFVSAESGAGVRIGVGQHKGRPTQVVVQGTVTISSDVERQISELPLQERNDLLWDIRFKLLALGVDFDGVTDPPKKINIAKSIYYDGLTKDRFLQRISQTRNGVLTVLWMLARKFSQPPPERTLGFKPPEGS